MKEIYLSKGKVSIVDDEDYDELSKYTWSALEVKDNFYAVTMPSRSLGKRTMILMHRFLLGVEGKQKVDHQNHNGLDNRRENLRICTNAENMRNRIKHNAKGTSKYKGVSYKEDMVNKWRARIGIDGKEIVLGYFLTEVEAAKAYNEAALKYHKEFSHLNSV